MSFYAELESGDSAVAAELLDTVKWPLGWKVHIDVRQGVLGARNNKTIGFVTKSPIHWGPTRIGMIEIPELYGKIIEISGTNGSYRILWCHLTFFPMLLLPANKIKRWWCFHISYTQLYEKMCELYPLDHCFVGALTLIWIQVVLSVQLVFVCPDLQGWSCQKKEIWELKSQEKVNGLVCFGEKERSIKKTNLPGGQVVLGEYYRYKYTNIVMFLCVFTHCLKYIHLAYVFV